MNAHSSGSTRNASVAHLPHIDGLRAFAILPVLLFHIHHSLCPGGYVGVDVFFVISGFLITSGLVRELDAGRFSLGDFYHRRICRIMPAYFVMVLGVLLFGLLVYYASPLVLLGDGVSASTLFLANFHFMAVGGDYFGGPLQLQVLSHLWSLSVEEQFYLFIPLFFLFGWSRFRRRLVPTLCLLTGLSFLGAVVEVLRGRQAMAFYLPHLRAWELLAGSLLAFLSLHQAQAACAPADPEGAVSVLQRVPWPESRTGSSLIAMAGLAMVLVPCGLLTSDSAFPGLAALSSVLGTFLLISHGRRGWLARLLSWKPFTFIGKISYSLYLWHWPITVYWKYLVYDDLTGHDYVGMAAVSLIAAYLSWKFVESPARKTGSLTRRHAFAFAAACILVLTALGTAVVRYGGWPSRLHTEANQVAWRPQPRDPFVLDRALWVWRMIGGPRVLPSDRLRAHDAQLRAEIEGFNQQTLDGSGAMGKPGCAEILLLGDSHASVLHSGLDQLLRASTPGYAITYGGTDMFDLGLADVRRALGGLAPQGAITKVILAERWLRSLGVSVKPENAKVSWDKLEAFARLMQARHIKLYIVTDVPNHGDSPCDIAARVKIFPPRHRLPEWTDFVQSEADFQAMQGAINARLAALCAGTGAVFIPLHQAFKGSHGYVSSESRNGVTEPLYRDDHHLTRAGSLLAARFIVPYLAGTGR